jgi:hypothetical protein
VMFSATKPRSTRSCARSGSSGRLRRRPREVRRVLVHPDAGTRVCRRGQPPTASHAYGTSEEAYACSDLARLRDFAPPLGKRDAAVGPAKDQRLSTSRG